MHLNWDIFTRFSPLEIQLHWATAFVAFFLGAFIFARPKGTVPHKTLGAIYAILMVTTSVSAFFIRQGTVSGLEYLSLKGMSWIHIFVPVTLIGIAWGLYGILVLKNGRAHRGPLIGSYIGALVIAGAFTFIPGRRMHAFFFMDPERAAALVN